MSQEESPMTVDQALSDLTFASMLSDQAASIANDVYRITDEEEMRDKQLVIAAVAEKSARLTGAAFDFLEQLLREKGLA